MRRRQAWHCGLHENNSRDILSQFVIVTCALQAECSITHEVQLGAELKVPHSRCTVRHVLEA